MALDAGFNFRSTEGYVTDVGDEEYVTADDVYPETRGIADFGWDDVIPDGDRNRDSGVDRRLAGINFVSNNGSSQQTFRVDLEATGDHEISLANGDTGGGQAYQYVELLDNASSIRIIDDSGGTSSNNYNDATGVNRAEADWPSENAQETHTFTSTIFNMLIGTPDAQSASTTVAHVRLVEVGGGAPSFIPKIMWMSNLYNIFTLPNLILAGIFGIISRNPKVTKRELLNPFKWFEEKE